MLERMRTSGLSDTGVLAATTGPAVAIAVVHLALYGIVNAVPGAPIGRLTALAFAGGTWAPGMLGLPTVPPALVSSIACSIVFAMLAQRYFRWDPRV